MLCEGVETVTVNDEKDRDQEGVICGPGGQVVTRGDQAPARAHGDGVQ